MDEYLVVTTSSAVQTDMIQELLQQNGIRSYAQTDNPSEGLQALFEGSAPFGNNIFVNQSDFEKARELVDAFFEENKKED